MDIDAGTNGLYFVRPQLSLPTNPSWVREATILAFVMAFSIQPAKKMFAVALHVYLILS